MKKIIITLLLFAVNIILAQTPTTSENYVYTKVYLSEDGSKKAETVQYFDGLGRPKQVVHVKASPLGQDLVVPVVYDALGRQTKTLLPIPVATANLGIHIIDETSVNNYYGVNNAYSEQKLEASPLGRVQEVASPGDEWAMGGGHTIKMHYLTNIVGDQVKKYNTTTAWGNGILTTSISSVSFFTPNQLSKRKVTDEDGNYTTEFKNSEGKTVLLRKLGGGNYLDTYYVYNNYGQLAFIISPKGDKKITSNNNVVTTQILNDLCYQYVYDNRFRLVEKKLPGKGREYMVYDQQNRLVATQDTNDIQNANRWLFTRYDKFDRTVYTGVFHGGTRAQEQTNANAKGLNNETRSTSSFTLSNQEIFYTNTAYPSGNFVPYSVDYYDSYPGASAGNTVTPPTSILLQLTLTTPYSVTQNGVSSIRSLKSMPTVSMVKNLDDNSWSSTYMWYDRLGRSIGSHSKNHLGGYTKTEALLDFAGVPQQSVVRHKRLSSDAEKVITQNFTYDHQNRLKVQKHQVNNNPEEILAQNEYNELSQLKNKKVGGISVATPLQTVDYSYNIRGWMTQINNPENLGTDLFGFTIKYNTPENSTAKYNGNITEVDWRKNSYNDEDSTFRRYSFEYDDNDRLSQAVFSEPNLSIPVNNKYDEALEYDANGNITRLWRNAPSFSSNTPDQIDDLYYEYQGNRLTSINDDSGKATGYEGGGSQIDYDANGNMITMPDKLMDEIIYNHLNLPVTMKIESNKKIISYRYRADGSKLKKNFIATGDNGEMYASSTEYLDGFHYSSSNGDELWAMFQEAGGGAYEAEAFEEFLNAVDYQNVLKFIPTAEGFYDFENNQYIYQYKDHLGNVRLSYKKEGNSLTVTDSNDYYPFGMSFVRNEEQANFGTGSYTNYKYNGKELQETGMYDYGWRHYMPDIARWNGMDALAEAYTSHSPYAYVANNPINYFDPDGMQIVETSTGWTFTGSDINLVHSYLTSGTSIGSNYSSLMQQLDSFDFSGGSSASGGGGISSFWSSFNGGTTFGGLSIGNNGTLSWWTNMPQTGIAGDIQGLTNHRSNLRSDNGSVGQPGELESIIPVWGSGRAAFDHFQNGNYWRGLGYTALAVSDVFLVKSLATMAVRGTITLASKHVVKQAVKNPILTTREAYRLAVTESKGVAALMKGKGVDRAFREGATRNWILNPAQKAGLIQINPMNRGADMVGKGILKGTWWDVTTVGSWQSHVNKYGPGGIGLFY